MAAASVEDVKGINRFECGLFKEVGTTAAGDGEKLDGMAEDGVNKPRTPTTHGSNCTCHPFFRYNCSATRGDAYVCRGMHTFAASL